MTKQAREVPYCTLCLVICTLTCHTLVLVGNIKTAQSFDELGHSTRGWSNVGLGISRSLRDELSEIMDNVTTYLVDSITSIQQVQEAMDLLLSLAGNQTEGVQAEQALRFLQVGMAKHDAVKNRTNATNGTADNWTEDLVDGLEPLVNGAIDTALDTAFDFLTQSLDKLLNLLKPPLQQVEAWLVSFGDRVQSVIQTFSTALDMIQKIFDQIMSQLHGGGGNDEDMLRETFNLFDVSNTGYVTIQDLKDVGSIYSISALGGNKPENLTMTYDVDGDLQLDRDEMANMVNDPSVPEIMSVVLGTVANKLAQVAGKVGGARMRLDVAGSVVEYFQIVCAKNATKVVWVSDALGNGSMPMEFTAAIYGELCRAQESPDSFTIVDVGQLVIATIYSMHPEYAVDAYHLMSEPEFWISNGFPAQQHASCVEQVTTWVVAAQTGEAKPAVSEFESGNPNMALAAINMTSKSDLEVLLEDSAEVSGMGRAGAAAARKAAASAAKRRAKVNMDRHFKEKMLAHQRRRAQLYHTATSKRLMHQLLNGQAATDSSNPVADAAANGGVPAANETLRFAHFLSNNATATAKRFQNMCFDYTSKSSNTLDSFAQRIKGMVSTTHVFLDNLKDWATPTGIENLEETFENFARDGLAAVKSIVENTLQGLVNDTLPGVAGAVDSAVTSVGDSLGHTVGNALGGPIGTALQSPLMQVLSGMFDPEVQNNPQSQMLAAGMAQPIGDAIGNALSGFLSPTLNNVLHNLVGSAIGGVAHTVDNALDITGNSQLQSEVRREVCTHLKRHASLRRDPALLSIEFMSPAPLGMTHRPIRSEIVLLESSLVRARGKGLPDFVSSTVSNVWAALQNVLATLLNLVPTAVDALATAKGFVLEVASNLDTVFEVFESKGTSIFGTISKIWRILWISYFCTLSPLTLLTLAYAFWAGGFLGGPQPVPDEDLPPPQTFRDKCGVCWRSCTGCCAKCHDLQFGFWSMVIIMEILVLIIFIVGVLLCILSGVKAFISAGCSQIYLLSDPTSCSSIIYTVKSWLATFQVGAVEEVLDDICPDNHLLTCQLIGDKMRTSAILTLVCSLAAAVLSLQLIFDAATLHEKARYRRLRALSLPDEDESKAQEYVTM